MTEHLVAPASQLELAPLELVGGMPFGTDAEQPPLPDVPSGLRPITAFENAVRRGLEQPPCVVTFSGGRDSAAVLSVATRLARSEGHELPLPVTVRIVDAPGSVERDWQERLVRHLSLDDWVVLEVGDEVDYVGPVAQRLLLRHGVRHPAARLLFWLQLEHARGGSLLTGFGGDAVMGGWLPAHYAEARAGRARLGPRDALPIAFAFAPEAVRRAVMRRRLTLQPWLRPEVAHALREIRAGEFAARPRRWSDFLAWEQRLRRGMLVKAALAELGAEVEARVVHPLHDRSFVAALARVGGSRGLGDRTAATRAVFGDDLPDDVVGRPSKATFTLAYFRGPTRAFARRWDGRGLDPDLVDAERLRAAWLQPIVDQRSSLTLQAAWLDSVRRGVEQPVADALD